MLARRINDNSGVGSGNQFYVKNHLGSTMFLTNGDGTTRMAHYDYFPYGKKITLQGTPEYTSKTFTGKELDRYDEDMAEGEDGEGWYYFGARYYDADIGGWTSTDQAEEYHSPYTYVGNNPIKAVDPNGLWTVSAGFGLGYAVTAKIGYYKGRFTFGMGAGEGVGAKVGWKPGGSIGYADKGISAEMRVVAEVKASWNGVTVGGKGQAIARADQAGNYENKSKFDMGSFKFGDKNAIKQTLSYEIGERGNTSTGTHETFEKVGSTTEVGFGAMGFVGAEVEVSGSLNDLRK